ncbi:phosphonate C-P lyase system protein PhnG [Jiella marina]|uniref:phosphonate C-P lyase system protein PhnG n=1 Tax=Jiella sp. LLJ827 TaxID=2917712 RepID=UPI0021007CE5|nr:phosphonate C-P lyase system protein PhnG [Jiella sp. LLJ827]MCQ0986133.1 phosphonate C-P lyase system protein PhnG [Jiella sp. LLJ827]
MAEKSASGEAREQANEQHIEARRRAVSAFAQAETDMLARLWEEVGEGRPIAAVRGPEVGLVMVRGRVGGGGAPFNLGEASVTRASVRLGEGTVGHAMTLGRDLERARLAASFDALWQLDAAHRDMVESRVVLPIEAAIAEAETKAREETEATRVDFFTMARGEDE